MTYITASTRLLFRELNENDLEDLYEMDADPEVHRFIDNNPVQNRDQLSGVIKMLQQQYKDYGIGRWAVVDKITLECIGWAGLKYYKESLNNHKGFYELGYRFKKKHWGKGYATEAAQAVIHYGFTGCKLHRIIATCQPENTASWRIMEKIGMRKEGYFKKCIPTKDGWWDEYYYAILAEEYLSWFSGCPNIH